MLLAVLEKRLGIQLSTMDIFLNVTGGLKTDDPAVDLAVCVATLSSFYDKAMPDKTCFAAEVGLGGELRPVSRVDMREQESKRLGFNYLIKARDFVEDNGSKSAFETLSELTVRLFGSNS
jgi:DNA repair protein RadA/Sms